MANSNPVPADAELRSKSVTSINTLASIGFGDAEGKSKALDEDSYSAGSAEFTCLEAESHCIPKDVICLLVICQQHQAIAFKQIVNDCYFLPTFQFDGDSQSLSDTVRNVVGMHDQSMLNGISVASLISSCRKHHSFLIPLQTTLAFCRRCDSLISIALSC